MNPISRMARVLSEMTFGLVLAALTVLSGCSVYMEATRPTPVDLTQFSPDTSRDTVIERVGAPMATTKEASGESCDLYKLYTHGYGGGGRASIAFLEGAADVVTFGLAEAVSTPVEAATKNEPHPVTICYRDAKLSKISEDGNVVVGPGTQAVAAAPPPSAVANTDSQHLSADTDASSAELKVTGTPPTLAGTK